MDSGGDLYSALPGYGIGTELGRGTFGVVVAGGNRQMGRSVAIKRLFSSLTTDDAVRARFQSEATRLASFEHPHVVPVYDHVRHEDSCILVTEFLAAGSLRQRFTERGLDQRDACAIALAVCSGLHAAHQHGILHLDLKPENVLFGTGPSLKVTDFALARIIGQDDALASLDGSLLGTATYMAPEQVSGTTFGPAIDIYALGVMLYELLSGRLPYRDDGGPTAILLRHMNEDATPLSDVAPTVPAGIGAAVMQALARSPENRFHTAEAFGIAIGASASASWGPDWLEDTAILVHDSGPIVASVRSAPTNDDHPISDQIIRAVPATLPEASAGQELSPGDLLPLRHQNAPVPPFPKLLFRISIGLMLIALVLGLFGVTASEPHSQIPAGHVTVNAHALTGPNSVPLDLDKHIPVVVHRLPSIGGHVTAQIVLSFAGVEAVHSTVVPLVHRNGAWRGSVDASDGRYLVGGELAASLRLTGIRGAVSDAFTADVSRPPFLTFLGVTGLVLLLLVVALARSLLGDLRRGYRRRQRTLVAGLVVVGIFAGVTASVWGWILGLSLTTFSGLAVPAVVGAAAGAVGGVAAVQMGRRTRAQRQHVRLVLVARPGGVAPERRVQWLPEMEPDFVHRGQRGRVTRLGGAALALGAMAALTSGPPAGAATPHVTFSAIVGGQPAQLSTDAHPAQISPMRSTPVRITVRNGDSTRLRVATVRLGGQVLGLPLYSYNTSVGLVLPPGTTKSLLFFVDMTGAGNQATGLVTSSISILGPDGTQIASHPLITQVDGSLTSLYGLFGLAVLVLTAASLLLAVVALIRHTLPAQRWRRCLRFFIPGFGLGLVLVFLLSAFAVFSPSTGHWLTLLVVTSVTGLAVGYLVPPPAKVVPDDYEDDPALARLVVVDQDPLLQERPTDRVFPAGTASGTPDNRATTA